MSHRGSLLLLPSGIWAWPVTEASAITVEALAPVIAEADRIGLFLIGTGAERWPLPVELMQLFASAWDFSRDQPNRSGRQHL